MDTNPSLKVDTFCMECIPFCAKFVQAAKSVPGADGACVPSNPNHPTYSVETLRALFISYLYLFKWVKWNPYFTAHGTLVADVLVAIGRAQPGLPMVMEVGELCTDILVHHPHLAGDRVNSQVHSSFGDRSLPMVLPLICDI